jgi:hypothetical protein
MGWLKTTVIVVIVLGALSIAGILWFLSVNGRAVFIDRVSSLTNRKVTLGAVRPVFPMGLELDDLAIEGLLTALHARVNVDVGALLLGELTFSSAKLVEPVLFLERGSDSVLKPPPPAGTTQDGVTLPAAARPPVAKRRPVVLKKLAIDGGVLCVRDVKAGREWTVDKIAGDVENVPLTGTPVRTKLFLTASLARMEAPFVGHFLKAKGWVNWAGRDMDVLAQVVDDTGRVGLDVKLVSKANDLLVDGKARFRSSHAKVAAAKSVGVVESAALGVLSALGTDIDVGFSFHTQMDRFDVGQISLSGNVVTDLQTQAPSGTIVSGLKAVGDELLKQGEPEAKP